MIRSFLGNLEVVVITDVKITILVVSCDNLNLFSTARQKTICFFFLNL